MVLGGTWFLGRRVVERLHERGDEVLVTHRGHSLPHPWVDVEHLLSDRHALASHSRRILDFAPQAIVDTCALTGAAVDAVLPVLPDVPTVVLSSQDVYQAHTGLRDGTSQTPLPITEDSELRRVRYPYRGAGFDQVPDDYDKLDVEERWDTRGATILRLPLLYGPHDWQAREEPLLRRVRAGRREIPVGAANLLWTRAHVEDVATGVLAALDTRAADGRIFNLGETRTWPLATWFRQILDAAGSDAELVRVSDDSLPSDMALSAAQAQHLLVSVTRAQQVLDWRPSDPPERVRDSVHWHIQHPPAGTTWTQADTAADDNALAGASS